MDQEAHEGHDQHHHRGERVDLVGPVHLEGRGARRAVHARSRPTPPGSQVQSVSTSVWSGAAWACEDRHRPRPGTTAATRPQATRPMSRAAARARRARVAVRRGRRPRGLAREDAHADDEVEEEAEEREERDEEDELHRSTSGGAGRRGSSGTSAAGSCATPRSEVSAVVPRAAREEVEGVGQERTQGLEAVLHALAGCPAGSRPGRPRRVPARPRESAAIGVSAKAVRAQQLGEARGLALEHVARRLRASRRAAPRPVPPVVTTSARVPGGLAERGRDRGAARRARRRARHLEAGLAQEPAGLAARRRRRACPRATESLTVITAARACSIDRRELTLGRPIGDPEKDLRRRPK